MRMLSRRDALKLEGIAGGSLLLPLGLLSTSKVGDAGSPKVTPFSRPFKVPPVLNCAKVLVVVKPLS